MKVMRRVGDTVMVCECAGTVVCKGGDVWDAGVRKAESDKRGEGA